MSDEKEARLTQLLQSLQDVESRFEDAARQLEEAATALAGGRLPNPAASNLLKDLEGRFTSLRDSLNLAEGVTDLEALRRAIEAAAAADAVEGRRQEVLAHLDALQRLEHVAGELADALGEIRSSAAAMSRRVARATTPTALEHEVVPAAPFLALARLVSEPGLSEAEMVELETQLGDAVPRVVAIAALRGNVRIEPGAQDEDVASSVDGAKPKAFDSDIDSLDSDEVKKRWAEAVRERTITAMEDGVEDDESAVRGLLGKFPPTGASPALQARLDTNSTRLKLSSQIAPAVKPARTVRTDGANDRPRATIDTPEDATALSQGQGTVTESTDADQATDRPEPSGAGRVAGEAPEGETSDVSGASDSELGEDPVELDVASIASRVAELATGEPPDDVWRLVRDGRLSLAYHLAQAMKHEVDTPSIPHWLAGALALGPHVRKPLTGAIAPRLASMLGESSHEVDRLWRQDNTVSLALLASAATLLPSIIAPNTGVITIVQGAREPLRESFPNLAELLHIAAEYCERGSPLDIRRWRTIDDVDTWSSDRKDLQAEAAEWLDRARHYKASYQPATEVWHRWLQPQGILGDLVQRVIHGATITRAEADELVHRFQDASEFGDLLDASFRDVLGKRWRGQQITGNARRSLERNAAEAVDLIDRCVGLIEQRPDAPKSYETRQAEQLRDDLKTKLPAVLDELSQTNGAASEGHMAVARARSTVETLQSLLAGVDAVSLRETSPDALLNDEIALCDIDIDSTGAPFGVLSSGHLAHAIRAVACDPPDWLAAFDRRLSKGDTVGAEFVLRRLQASDGTPIDDLARRFETEVEGLRHQLDARVLNVQKSLEVALSLGLLGEEEHVDLIADVNEVVRELAETAPRFDRIKRELDGIEDSIADVQSKRKDQIEQHVRDQALDTDSEAYRRIRAALDDNDFVTASEYLFAAVENSTLFDATLERRDAFREFFIERFDVISEVIRKQQTDLPRAVRKTSVPKGAVDMKNVPKPQAEAAADLLDTWLSLKRAKRGTGLEDRLEKVLGHLGFVVETVTASRPAGTDTGRRRFVWFKATVQPVANRNQCPVPQFGSAAHGRYRILCLWDRQGEEDIVNVIGDERHGAPVLVFHFGTVTETRRRTIARLAKQRKQSPFIVVDDAAILFLCGERGARMPVLFDILLPFAALEPYTTTASQVPAEMFYGRDRERRALRDPHGSSFVYGGRQLGKTALLRAVEAEAHDPEHGQVAVWIDLKSENIGISRKPTDLWTVITRVLKNKNALPDSLPHSSSVPRLEEAIKQYLSEDPERRILLLLDEADKFLESDTADNFAVTSRLKGLMDATDRRFKVVLAGLHNVQRVTRHVNQPLAHYGDPICVGPLLQNGEVRAARELIQRPFAALGYRFESDDLVTRILGQTNYYPSLIQLYCMHLLRHLMDVPFSVKTTPPYVITSEHLDEVYRSQELHKAIRSRFQLTLDLDQRYEVLALAIASLCLDDPSGLLDGYTTQTIRGEALDWWAEGFEADSSLSAFEALLDEMIGLGILRRASSRKYTLRNRNVMDLMGSREDIETRLLHDREPPAEFEPSTFRSQVDRGNASWLSPLTAQQETALVPRTHGVSFVFGTPAADLDLLGRAFNSYDGALRIVKDASDARSFERNLDAFTAGRKEATIVLVDPVCPWSDEWVTAANQKIRSLRSRDRFVRVVFAGAPDTLRALQKASSRILAIESDPPVSLGPWGDPAVRAWLASREYPNLKPEDRKRLKQVTGYWPILLRRFASLTHQEPAKWASELESLDSELDSAPVAREMLEQFSLDHQELIELLAVLDGFGESTADDLATLLEPPMPLEYVQAELDVGTNLRYIRPAGHGTYRVDPVVGRLARVARS